MNEFLFFVQALCILGFAGFAFRLGNATLITWVTVQALIANLFVLKQITLFGFNVTASDAFAIGSLMGLNLLQEYFGSEEAKKATTTCFFFLLFFAVVSQLHLFYTPSAHDVSNEAFVLLLSPSPRLFLASMATFFVVQRFDIIFFAFLQKKLPMCGFAVRTCLSLIVSQALDTILFSMLGLYGIAISLIDVIVVSFAVKLLSIFFFTSGIRWAKG
ncbi:MAG: queuosine precursor transporter [Parachlamydiaceae bacterium]|nr:queuosine precursor transporter [Parachlamydiaceae bacterium]